jgi:hypothetical protein
VSNLLSNNDKIVKKHRVEVKKSRNIQPLHRFLQAQWKNTQVWNGVCKVRTTEGYTSSAIKHLFSKVDVGWVRKAKKRKLILGRIALHRWTSAVVYATIPNMKQATKCGRARKSKPTHKEGKQNKRKRYRGSPEQPFKVVRSQSE